MECAVKEILVKERRKAEGGNIPKWEYNLLFSIVFLWENIMGEKGSLLKNQQSNSEDLLLVLKKERGNSGVGM